LKPKTFMLIAGEASGDLLAAELVSALRGKLPDATFFGAGGAQMSAAGVELAFDLTQHSVIGISDVLKNYFKFRRLFHQLLALAIERKPDVVIGVDYGGFNLRFGHAVREYVRNNPFSKWNPKIVQFVSPQVWASRPGRANRLAADYDLLLSIFPFEKDWYAQRVPKLRVEFVGHPMIGRFAKANTLECGDVSPLLSARHVAQFQSADMSAHSKILLLPGSRRSELQWHLPVMIAAAKLMVSKSKGILFSLVLPNEQLIENLWWQFTLETGGRYRMDGPPTLKDVESCASELGLNLKIQIGNLPQVLAQADVAIASTGTVTMECAFFGVPTVTLYKTSWLTYQIAKRIITVKSLTMPNLLAGETVYPEFVQHDATPENLSRATLELLQDESRRTKIKSQLAKIVSSLGEPGAAGRAATAILSLFK
jgi:lipid-A-disaccharide synthase